MREIQAKGILSAANGMNVYRGCTHGCIYCDSRSLCYHTPIPFEDIEAKVNAPELLEDALRRRRKPCMVGTGAMCDPYMPCEAELGLTRRCLEIIRKYGFGACVQTKSDLILRDLELLKSINERSKCVVQMTLTTADENLCRKIEPNVCTTARRAEVLEIMRENGIPTVVWMTPILPFINDTEENLRALLEICVRAEVKGIIIWNFGVTLREGDREYFYAALDRDFPGIKQKYIEKFGNSYECISENNARLMGILREECRKNGIMCDIGEVFGYMHAFPENAAGEQMCML